jgi:hypothetical protein
MLHLPFHNFVSPVASTVVNHSGRDVAACGMYHRIWPIRTRPLDTSGRRVLNDPLRSNNCAPCAADIAEICAEWLPSNASARETGRTSGAASAAGKGKQTAVSRDPGAAPSCRTTPLLRASGKSPRPSPLGRWAGFSQRPRMMPSKRPSTTAAMTRSGGVLLSDH